MANMQIYFLIEGNEALRSYIVDVGNQLADSTGAKCMVVGTAEELLRRLVKRKTRPALLVLLANDPDNGFICRLCSMVGPRSQPEKLVFVSSCYSPLTEEQLGKASEILERNGICGWRPLSLSEISSGKEVSAIFERAMPGQ